MVVKTIWITVADKEDDKLGNVCRISHLWVNRSDDTLNSVETRRILLRFTWREKLFIHRQLFSRPLWLFTFLVLL
jgi:hypothetical protein